MRPVDALNTFRASRGVLIEPNLLHQLGVNIGSSITMATRLLLELCKVFLVRLAAFLCSPPRIYLPVQFLEETGLTAFGSQIRYRYLLRMKPEVLAERTAEDSEARKHTGVRAGALRRRHREETVGAAIERAYLLFLESCRGSWLPPGMSLAHGANALPAPQGETGRHLPLSGTPDCRQAAYAVLWEML